MKKPPRLVSPLAKDLRLYDSFTQSVKPFTPLERGKVGIYMCGATVQSSPHIGHMRTAIAFDIIRRWLERLDFDVTFIRNVTDLDDKILRKAREAGWEWWAWAYRYEREFTACYNLLGVEPPTYEPRATGTIPAMVSLVERLIERGHAYVLLDKNGKPSGNVFFDVQSWPLYGELTHQGGEVISEEESEFAKKDPRDFALWKGHKKDEPQTAQWPTPFGWGRPAWHLECSAMSHRYLGEDFDIHAGGLDLRFPHHENEIAQSKAAGWGFAHTWMHSAWVTQKGEKMSKSLGNGLSVDTLLASYSPWVIRYALGAVHYRSMLEWDESCLKEAQSAWDRITHAIEAAALYSGRQPSREDVEQIAAKDLPSDFTHALNDDFKVPLALSALSTFIHHLNTCIAERGDVKRVAHDLLLLRAMLDTLGLDPLSPVWENRDSSQEETKEETVLDALIREEIEKRNRAKKEKDFVTADKIRDHLATLGIVLKDNREGTSWFMKK